MHPPDQLDGDVGGAGDRESQGRQVVAVTVGMIEDRLVHRRRAREHRHRLLGHRAQEVVDLEHRLGDDGGAAHERREAARLVPEHVEERVDDHVGVALEQPRHVAPVGELAERLRVRHEHALGRPGGARREQHVAHVVAADCTDPAVDDVVVDRVAGGLELAQRLVGRGAVVEAHDRQQLGKLAPQSGQGRRVVDAEELTDGERDPCTAAGEDVAHLLALEARVHRHDRAAGAEDAERGDQPLVPVGRPHRGALTRLETGGDQTSRDPSGVGDQLGERDATTAIDDRVRVTEARRRVEGHRGDRRPEEVSSGGHVSSGASDARNSRVRRDDATISSLLLPNGRMRAEKSVVPASMYERSRRSMSASVPMADMSPTSSD